MPKKSSNTSVADELAAPGGAAAVDQAISLLAAFRAGDKSLTVTELAERTRLYKSTVLRLLASLAHGRLLHRNAEGHWMLGPEVSRLASIYSASFSLEDIVLPEMRELVQRTQESASFCSGSTRRNCCETMCARATCCRSTAALEVAY